MNVSVRFLRIIIGGETGPAGCAGPETNPNTTNGTKESVGVIIAAEGN